MGKFTDADVARLSFCYEDVSEPLKEYEVGYDGYLHETPSSCTLLGVKKDGKWGWIETSGCFVIPHVYDSGWILCYNGIIHRLEQNGYVGGLFRRDFSVAFSFRYKQISHAYGDTFVVHNNEKCALAKPGDIMLTGFKYLGFSIYNKGNITEYVRSGFFGEKRGKIDLNTGRELS